MPAALERCIKADPERFLDLYMVYYVPTTDPRWAKKDLWLRQTRLTARENALSKSLQAARQMPTPTTPLTHEIAYDPETTAKSG